MSSNFNEFTKLVMSCGILVFDTETTGLDFDSKFISISLATGNIDNPDDPACINLDARDYTEAGIRDMVKPLFEDDNLIIIGHNIKYDLEQLSKLGIKVKGRLFDTLLAHWFVSPQHMENGLKPTVKELWGVDLPTYKQVLHDNPKFEYIEGKKKPKKIPAKNLLDIPREALDRYGIQDSFYTYKLFQHILPQLEKMPSKELLFKIDFPLIRILQSMEEAGIKLDRAALKTVGEDMQLVIDGIKTKLLLLAGEEINWDSPAQLSALLFGKLGLQPKKLTGKTNKPSTDDEVLSKLSAEGSEIATVLMEYRTLQKLIGTYVYALPNEVAKDGRIHGSFNIHGTATGRLSCDSPNLQQIPKQGELGTKIRECFVPEAGHVFIKADYSQMELRMLAHISGDHYLTYALRTGQDLHKLTAQTMYGREEITDDERGKAKQVNFGVIYGMKEFTLMEEIKSTLSEAREYLQKYFRMYPLVREWKWNTISKVRETGELRNAFGRVRYVDKTKKTSDRQALNTPIQSTCAELVKTAMLRLAPVLEPYKARIVLQVHDELLVECPEESASEVATLVKGMMESVNIIIMDSVQFFAKCPFIVDVSIIKSWGEKKE